MLFLCKQMIEVTIHLAHQEDLIEISQIFTEASGYIPGRIDEDWQRMIQAGGLLVAKVDNRTVGFGVIDTPASEQIKQLYVARAYQKKGIGGQILRELETIAMRAGLVAVMLHASPQAVDFYRRAGYTVVETLIDHDHDGVQMIKTFG